MIYLTGDTHGDIDIGRLSTKNLLKAGIEPQEGDYLIICGDFGLVWESCPSAQEGWWLRWLDKKPWTTLFVDGNHENFARLNMLPEEQWHGGTVHRVSDSVLHLMRGQVFDIEGKTYFTFGGAASHDRKWRVEGRSWWPEEMPADEEMQRGEAALDACGRRVDCVLTHCAPTLVQGRMDGGFLPDTLTEYLQGVRDTVEFDRWFFGHYHRDVDFSDGFCALYRRVMPIDAFEGGRGSAFA